MAAARTASSANRNASDSFTPSVSASTGLVDGRVLSAVTGVTSWLEFARGSIFMVYSLPGFRASYPSLRY